MNSYEGMIPIPSDQEGYAGYLDPRGGRFVMKSPDGQLVTMDIGQSDAHVDAALTNYASGYHNADFCADVVMPIVPVNKASDFYFEFDPDDALATVDGTQVSGGANVPEITPKLSTNRYATLGYALGSFLYTEILQNQDAPLNLEMKTTRVVMDRLMLNREVRVKTVMLNSANYTGSHLLDYSAAPTKKWNGGSASDPVRDIQAIVEASLMPITDMLMDRKTWNAFITNAAVQKYTAFKVNLPAIPDLSQRQMFAALLDLPVPHICEARAKITGGTYPYVWANDVVLFRRPPMDVPVDGYDIASAKTFRWMGGNDIPMGAPALQELKNQGGVTVRTFFNPYRGKKGGTQIIVTHDDAEQFITQNVSGLIKSAYQA